MNDYTSDDTRDDDIDIDYRKLWLDRELQRAKKFYYSFMFNWQHHFRCENCKQSLLEFTTDVTANFPIFCRNCHTRYNLKMVKKQSSDGKK